MARQLLLTCEHGGNRVPRKYAQLFRGQRRLLTSHRGYDAGALEMAQWIAVKLGAPLQRSTVTRLLIDLNRSLHHPNVFSEITAPLSPEQRQAIVDDHYLPYRQQVEQTLERRILRAGRVIHVSMHTFTPVLNGVQRTAEIGLLYDSRRKREAAFCRAWRSTIRTLRPDLRVRRNYPYLGKADGFTTALRRRFDEQHYVGIELEVNSALCQLRFSAWGQLLDDLAASLEAALQS